MTMILLRPPISGKATVANLLHEEYGFPLRASGDLVSDSLIISFIEKELIALQNASPVILDRCKSIDQNN